MALSFVPCRWGPLTQPWPVSSGWLCPTFATGSLTISGELPRFDQAPLVSHLEPIPVSFSAQEACWLGDTVLFVEESRIMALSPTGRVAMLARFPHRIEYMDGAGRTLAVETINEIEVDLVPFEFEQEVVTH